MEADNLWKSVVYSYCTSAMLSSLCAIYDFMIPHLLFTYTSHLILPSSLSHALTEHSLILCLYISYLLLMLYRHVCTLSCNCPLFIIQRPNAAHLIQRPPIISHPAVTNPLLPHLLQLLNDSLVRIHEPVHAVAHTRLLVSIQRSLRDL